MNINELQTTLVLMGYSHSMSCKYVPWEHLTAYIDWQYSDSFSNTYISFTRFKIKKFKITINTEDYYVAFPFQVLELINKKYDG